MHRSCRSALSKRQRSAFIAKPFALSEIAEQIQGLLAR
jgi:hypothetical protein